LGNSILSDDAVGLRIARAVRTALLPHDRITALELEEMGLGLLDYIAGYRSLILVDAIQTGRVPAGHLHEFSGDALETRRGGSPHFLGVADTLALGGLLGLRMPEHVHVLAIEVEDPFTLGEELTPAVAAVLPVATRRALELARSLPVA
jgi:hydrogenase maturation protease